MHVAGDAGCLGLTAEVFCLTIDSVERTANAAPIMGGTANAVPT